ncbi:MAG: histidine phosphatase family protein [Rhodomicrobium sp.]|nr:histidine phosphatase family protein [Rhodomicrobium sp.]
MPLIYFLRHGQTDYNAAGRIQGSIDVPVNAHGRAQAKRNGGVLNELIGDKSRFDFVASPLLRTRQTMEIARNAMGLPPEGYRTDNRLQEIHFGAWGGLTMAGAAASDPANYIRRQADPWNVAPPEGECFRELYARVMEWLAEVTADTVVVAHGGINRCLRGHYLKLPPLEIVHLDVPQDKVLMIEGYKLTWL